MSSRNSRGRAFRALRWAAPIGVAVLIAGCGGSSSTGTSGSTSSQASKSGSDLKIAAIIKGLDNPYFEVMEQGLKDGAAADGATINVEAAQSITDVSGQADKLQDVAGQNYNCIIVNPITGTNLVQGLTQATGKTIVNIDMPITTSSAKAAGLKIATYIGTDDTAAGEKAGTFMTKSVKPGSQVAIVAGTSGDPTSGERVSGFREAVKNVDIVQQVAANWERPQALTDAAAILQAHPKLAAFFVANDDMAMGVVKAVQNAGLAGKVKVISVDGTEEGLKSIKADGLTATVSQYPYEMGVMGVEACEAKAAGKSFSASIPAGTQLITKANVVDALADFPKPFTTFDDPLKSLVPKS